MINWEERPPSLSLSLSPSSLSFSNAFDLLTYFNDNKMKTSFSSALHCVRAVSESRALPICEQARRKERERNRDAPACCDCDAQLRPSTPLYRRQPFRRERISSSFLHETSHVHVKVHCRAPCHRCRHRRRRRCRSSDADLPLKIRFFAKFRTGSAKVFSPSGRANASAFHFVLHS